ncbi:MAG: 50S ribosomal protein L18e [Thermoplasmata archaeon]
MGKPVRKSNPLLLALIRDLQTAAREHEAPIWRDVARRLARPRRLWAEVNLSRLQRHAADGEVLVVPGKLLGTGRLTKALRISALQASEAARAKVEAAGGQVLDLRELVEENPRGSGVRIMG